ncbi:hypothetical protein [Massilia sp. 2TAF26]|uniref:hypothetical protein n=1 Tax=Massilia sp. 2TAF26 TaxID=3233012 RepID=UPI003F9C8B22
MKFRKIDALKIELDRESKQGMHYTVRFVLPGPIVFQNQPLIDLLHSIPLVRWNLEAQGSPKGDPGYF